MVCQSLCTYVPEKYLDSMEPSSQGGSLAGSVRRGGVQPRGRGGPARIQVPHGRPVQLHGSLSA